MKYFKYILIIGFISGCMNQKNPEKTGLEGKPLPQFNVLLMDSITNFNTKDIPTNKPVVIFLFSPYCPFCKAETKEVIENMSNLKDIHFYMLSGFPFSSLKKYYTDFHLEKYPNITVGRDSALFYKKYVKSIGIPYLAFYGKDKRLKQGLLGRVSAQKIKNIALE
jgi:thiol-disulfide isomerase/thioredoxin